MRSHWLRLDSLVSHLRASAPVPLVATLLMLAALAALGGCGGVGVSTAGTLPGNRLTIYSSLPLQGPLAPASEQIADGEKLALAQAGGRVGRFQIEYALLDDANPTSGEAPPGSPPATPASQPRTPPRSPTSASSTPPPPRSRCRSSTRPASSRSARRAPMSG